MWRLTHPNGSTVDYWDQGDANKAKDALINKELADSIAAGRDARPVLLDYVDSRTGLALV